MDQSKKTMRHFYCKDVLWDTFEQMANDFDCSIDHLVNEAMRSYARAKNFNSPSPSSPAQPPEESAADDFGAAAAGGDRDRVPSPQAIPASSPASSGRPSPPPSPPGGS